MYPDLMSMIDGCYRPVVLIRDRFDSFHVSEMIENTYHYRTKWCGPSQGLRSFKESSAWKAIEAKIRAMIFNGPNIIYGGTS